MEPHIRQNTELYQQAKSAFRQNFCKLMSNIVFRKTIDNIRGGIDVNLIQSLEEEMMRRLIAEQPFNCSVMFDNNLAGKVKFDRPVNLSISILGLSNTSHEQLIL